METIDVIEYWFKVPLKVMMITDKERRVSEIRLLLKKIDPELMFHNLQGRICLAIKVKE